MKTQGYDTVANASALEPRDQLTPQQRAYLQADRHDAATMAMAQRSGAAYISGNRDGYTVLMRVRLLDLG